MGYSISPFDTMSALVTLTFGLLLVLITCPGVNGGCQNTNNFGDSCDFLCHCKVAGTCDENGTCAVGCKSGLMGHSCQDGVNGNWWAPHVAQNISDHDSLSCDITQGLNSISIWPVRRQPFVWARVWSHNQLPVVLGNVTVIINDLYMPCSEMTLEHVQGHVIDIFCPDIQTAVTKIEFTGEGVESWCKVAVSGGRNIAYKQPITFNAGVTTNRESALVDNVMEDGECTEIQGLGEKVVTLTLPAPMDVYGVKVLGREDKKDQLRRIAISLLSSRGKEVGFWREPGVGRTISYFYGVTKHAKVKTVTVSTPASGVEHLTICELQVFGECPHTRTGLKCELECNCGGRICPQGRSCGKCPWGFSGENCIQPCPFGSYGANCKDKCSPDCKGGNCSITLGHCLTRCLNGRLPPFCEDRLHTAAATTTGTSGATLFILVFLIAVLLAVLFVILSSKKKSATLQKSGEDGSEKSKESEVKMSSVEKKTDEDTENAAADD